MTESCKDAQPIVVSYPPKCAGECKLPGAVIDMVGGVLAGNCSGPQTALPGEVRAEVLSTPEGVLSAGITLEAGGNRVCMNPRVARVTRDLVNRSFSSMV